MCCQLLALIIAVSAAPTSDCGILATTFPNANVDVANCCQNPSSSPYFRITCDSQAIRGLDLLPELKINGPFPKLALNGLTMLNFMENGITSLGEIDYPNLQWFSLGINQIEQLPGSFANLKSLKQIQLGTNKFNQFPKEVLSLPALENLYLGENKIPELPAAVADMPNLLQVDLGGNPIDFIDERLYLEKKGVEMIWNFRASKHQISEDFRKKFSVLRGDHFA